MLASHRGGLRRLRDAGGAPETLLREFPGMGPAGADIFLREVQGVWPRVAPRLDAGTLEGARRIGLPGDADTLAAAVGTAQLPRLAASVRVALDADAAREVRDGAAPA